MKKFGTSIILTMILSTLGHAQSIGGGGNHTIVSSADGIAYAWGQNSQGQLGTGNNTESTVPVAIDVSGVLSGKTITAVAAGQLHTIALASDGKVYTWGYNGYGQLGNGNNTESTIPVAVDVSGVLSGKTITAVDGGGWYYSVALASDGTVYTWGNNGDGQLGNGNNTSSNVPVAVDVLGVLSGKIITAIAANNHTIALASDGTVYTWGDNTHGKLGNGNTGTDSNVPVAVDMSGVLFGKTITAVDCFANHSIALASDGTVYTWGRNNSGQLGNGNNTDSNVPVAVDMSGALNGKTITAVAGGNSYSIALASDGTVYTWGDNYGGQLGTGLGISNVPVQVNSSGVLSGKTITAIAGGNNHAIALGSDGTAYTWGYNASGQLGNGNKTSSSVPVIVDQSSIGALPVELSSFTANILENKVILNWHTATEINNYGFEILRSAQNNSHSESALADEESWEKVGFVAGHGNSNSPKEYSFIDDKTSEVFKNLGGLNAVLKYRLKQIDFDGNFEYSKIITVWTENILSIPTEFRLEQNYPNPFNPTTTIKFGLPEQGFVDLRVYNILGEEVSRLVNQELAAGYHEVNFGTTDISSGMYIYRIDVKGKFSSVKKMLMIK